MHGPQARLEDMVRLIGLMAGSDITGDGRGHATAVSTHDGMQILDILASVAASQSRLISYECIAAGLNYGLELSDMQTVLHSSSGWSMGSRHIFSELLDGEQLSKGNVDEALRDLQDACSLASQIGVPLTIANETRSIIERMQSQHGTAKRINELARLYPATARTVR
ncbi:hypothetical protein BHUM_05597c [Candidatus Burkholderia humilis]|nr:hypothetical protein BHUM_05597c [Candidatus Burkholderia humilis]